MLYFDDVHQHIHIFLRILWECVWFIHWQFSGLNRVGCNKINLWKSYSFRLLNVLETLKKMWRSKRLHKKLFRSWYRNVRDIFYNKKNCFLLNYSIFLINTLHYNWTNRFISNYVWDTTSAFHAKFFSVSENQFWNSFEEIFSPYFQFF